jgi:hypothetical protein
MQRRIEIGVIPLGWPGRIVAVLVAVLLVVLGLVLGLVVLGLGAVAAVAVGARVWWLRRRLRREGVRPGVTVVEGEYRVVERQIEHRDGDRDV